MDASQNEIRGSGGDPGFADAFREIVASLKSRRLAVFCGAGVSFHSGLPLARHLIQAILTKLAPNEPRVGILLDSSLPFEAFMETLRAESDVAKLWALFELGQPNTNHILFARLAKSGYLRTLCTVNFDLLFERALADEGLKAGDDYAITYQDKDFDAVVWDDPTKLRLIKLHGSAGDFESMAITLRQVANRTLSAGRRGVIAKVFSLGNHNDVLVLGYSCSDVFDISPHIETLTGRHKRVFFIDHRTVSEGGAAGLVENLSARSEKNPFRSFTHGLRIQCDTDQLIRAIWAECLSEPYRCHAAPLAAAAWQTLVDEWHQQFDAKPGTALQIAGQVFSRISAWGDAATCFERAVAAARSVDDLSRVSHYLSHLGQAHTHLSNFSTAIKCHEEGIQLAQKVGNRLSEATNMHNLAGAYRSTGDLERAMQLLQQVAPIVQELNDPEGIAACYGEMGSLALNMGQMEKGIEFLSFALEVAEHDSNLASQVLKLSDLGAAYQLANDFKKATEYYEAGLALARKIGHKGAEGKMLANLGLIHAQGADPDTGIKYLEQSREIAENVGDLHSLGDCLGGLGVARLKQGEYQVAVDLFHQSLQVGRRIGNRELIVKSLMHLALAYSLISEWPRARQCDAEARQIARGSAHMERIVLSLDEGTRATLWEKLQFELLRCLSYRRFIVLVDAAYIILGASIAWIHSAFPGSALAKLSLVLLIITGLALSASFFHAAKWTSHWRSEVIQLGDALGIVTGRQITFLRFVLKASGSALLSAAVFLAMMLWFTD